MECPCKNCMERKVYAKTLDIHIYGEDCPYECKEYEHWKQFQKELNGNSIDIIVRCKDCKWWHESETNEGYGDCGQANGITLKSSDWFCADGKRG